MSQGFVKEIGYRVVLLGKCVGKPKKPDLVYEISFLVKKGAEIEIFVKF